MRKLVVKMLSIFIVMYAVCEFTPWGVAESTGSIVVFSIFLVVVNMLIKPILLLISLPITLLTFGLFSLVINGFMIVIVDHFMTDVRLENFFVDVVIAIAVTVVNHLLNKSTKAFD